MPYAGNYAPSSPRALPGTTRRETGSSPIPGGGGGGKAAKHKVDFSMTTRKKNSEVCFQVVNWNKNVKKQPNSAECVK